MASIAVMDAVEARIGTYWTATSPLITPNNAAETPADGSAFLSVQYPVSDTEQISVGAPGAQLFREEGGFRLVLSIPRDRGTRHWQAQLEALLAHFRSAQFSGVTTFAPQTPDYDDINGQGKYCLLSAVVPYYADVLA